jgi:hypothetical protein
LALPSFSFAACISTVNSKPLVSVTAYFLLSLTFFHHPHHDFHLSTGYLYVLAVCQSYTGQSALFFAVSGIRYANFHITID